MKDTTHRTERENKFLIWFDMPNHPVLHFHLLLIFASLLLVAQFVPIISTYKQTKMVDSNVDIYVMPSCIIFMIASLLSDKIIYRYRMDALREKRDSLNLDSDDEFLESVIDVYDRRPMVWLGNLLRFIILVIMFMCQTTLLLCLAYSLI